MYLMGAYQSAQVDFAELVDQRTLVLGFKVNQAENAFRFKDKHDRSRMAVLLSPDGSNYRYNSEQLWKKTKVLTKMTGVDIAPEVESEHEVQKQTSQKKLGQEGLDALRVKLISQYYDTQEKVKKNPGKNPGPVLRGDYHLQVTLESKRDALRVQKAVEKIRKAYKKEK